MARSKAVDLSRRERQIMDIIYAGGQCTAAEVLEGMHDPPSYSAVRATLRLLEEKGHLKHRQDGPRYIFMPTVPRDRARRSALKRMMQTFFDGSTEGMVATLLDMESSNLSADDLDRLDEIIRQAKKKGR